MLIAEKLINIAVQQNCRNIVNEIATWRLLNILCEKKKKDILEINKFARSDLHQKFSVSLKKQDKILLKSVYLIHAIYLELMRNSTEMLKLNPHAYSG